MQLPTTNLCLKYFWIGVNRELMRLPNVLQMGVERIIFSTPERRCQLRTVELRLIARTALLCWEIVVHPLAWTLTLSPTLRNVVWGLLHELTPTGTAPFVFKISCGHRGLSPLAPWLELHPYKHFWIEINSWGPVFSYLKLVVELVVDYNKFLKYSPTPQQRGPIRHFWTEVIGAARTEPIERALL